jgi:type IV pilus assembly protein PilM
MIRLRQKRFSPIGVDIGADGVKLVQLSADHTRLIDASRCQWKDSLTGKLPEEPNDERMAAGIARASERRNFRGREAVLCLNHAQLFLQSIRVPKGDRAQLDRTVQQEAAARVPFPVAEAEIRYLEAADIRQGEAIVRELILLACHRPIVDRMLDVVERAGLRPVAIDIQPAALVRTHRAQFRRDDERRIRSLLVDIGYSATTVVIAEQEEILFLKYLELAGRHFDEAVARGLRMELSEASALRRHHGDRRTDRQDPEIARSVNDATRPVLEQLCHELSLCVRYHSVTFRGQPLSCFQLGGGEATPELAELLGRRLGIPGQPSDPFRAFPTTPNGGRKGQWDVAMGLALRLEA